MNEYSLVLADNIKDCTFDYDELSGSVKELVKMHAELETQIKSIKTPLRKAYTKLKRALFGQPKHSVDEIMNMQLSIIRQIRRALQFQSKKTRTKLESVVNYSEALDNELEKSIQYRLQENPILEQLKKELDENSLVMQKQDKKQPGYFEKDSEANKKLREYKEKLHNYDLATEAVLDILQQREYLNLQEEIVRNTVYTSERLADKTIRIENQLSVIRGMYDSVLKQHKLYLALYHALGCQKTYLANLDDILMTGQQVMETIATKSQTINTFHKNPKLEGFQELTQFSSIDRREEKELLLAEYLGR